MNRMSSLFRSKITSSVEEVKRILGSERNPMLAENVPHTYDDKYNLAAWTTSLAAMGSLNVLEKLGFTQPQLELAKKYKQEGKIVTIRRLGNCECESLGKEEKMVESGTQEVTQSNSLFGSSKTTKSVRTKVNVYLWKYTCTWEVCMFPGTSFPEEKTTLIGRSGSVVLRVTGSDKPPFQKTNVLPYSDMSLDWFLSLLSDSGRLEFKIDRGVDTCRTPCQNEDIQKAKGFFTGLLRWCDGAADFVRMISSVENQARDAEKKTLWGLNKLIQMQEGMFVPIFPIMEMKQDSTMLSANDSHQFLERQTSGITKALAALQEKGKVPVPEIALLLSTTEATLAFMAVHGKNLCIELESSLRYIENMLYVQLENAVGKKIDFLEFQQYMRYHTSKLFLQEFSPKPFCYSVRRPGLYPEGTLMIETVNFSDEAKNEPVTTTVREAPDVYPMQFSLDAATKVTFGGRRFLHSMVRHTFKSRAQSVQLVARARQFSSYILLVGTLSSKSEFDPTDAIIVKNKDKLTVELLLETIPTAKEFKDAISSLSPEQQRFAKSFRSMQLAGTLFSVCIIQIKPQLETLLNLPSGSLTKEIKLTENLMDLFVEYQIPSDLLSYDGGLPTDNSDGTSTSIAPLEQVRSHVKKINDMLDGMKKKVVEEDALGAIHRRMESSDSDCDEDDLSATTAVFRAAPRKLRMGFARAAAPPPAPSAPFPRGRGPLLNAINKKKSMGGNPSRNQKQVPQQQSSQSDKASKDQDEFAEKDDEDTASVGIFEDLTKIPTRLDRTYEQIDSDAPLRSTKIKVGQSWTLSSQPSILDRTPKIKSMNAEDRKTEKNRAFDLLDALSKSGCLSIEHAELHVIVASTHCFERTVVDTVIQGNANPIEAIERSMLIVASAIQEKPVEELVVAGAVPALKAHSPILFLQQ